MTNAAAVIGLSYESTDLQDATIGLFLELVAGGPYETAAVRGEDVTVPALTGQIPMGRVKHERRIRLRGYAAGTGIDEQAQREGFETEGLALATLFDPTVVGTLTAILPSGAVATIDARPLPTILYDQVVPSMAQVDIELVSVDPDWVITPAGS